MLALAWVILQLVVSIKPGMVNIVDGEANVRQHEQVGPGKTIRTGARSHVELSLGLDVFLRLDEDSAVVLESVDSADAAVRIESGSGLIEVARIDKESRITVTSGSLKTVIDSKGVFRFSQNAASVLSGTLKMADKSAEVNKGWQI